MIRLSPNVVQLTPRERRADERFTELLNRGVCTRDALYRIRKEFDCLSDDFYRWLAD